ncbi:MAG: septum formation protein Maf [Deltaproteobacteria bacterium]|nr:septum formation protein Maf [Deltaproteobacteria bacterium]
MNVQLILASASPRRLELLNWAGISCEVCPGQVDESLHAGETPDSHVQRLALSKAEDVACQRPYAWVLAADTVVALGQKILGKPRDREDAIDMLKLLSGRIHQVYSGICLMNRELDQIFLDYVVTDVEFRALTEQDIENYIDSGEFWDKAGAYAIQGRGAVLARRIIGSPTNVIGLPLPEVLEWLGKAAIPKPTA